MREWEAPVQICLWVVVLTVVQSGHLWTIHGVSLGWNVPTIQEYSILGFIGLVVMMLCVVMEVIMEPGSVVNRVLLLVLLHG